MYDIVKKFSHVSESDRCLFLMTAAGLLGLDPQLVSISRAPDLAYYVFIYNFCLLAFFMLVLPYQFL